MLTSNNKLEHTNSLPAHTCIYIILILLNTFDTIANNLARRTCKQIILIPTIYEFNSISFHAQYKYFMQVKNKQYPLNCTLLISVEK